MAPGLAITFSGRIATGKTHVTQVLADALAWPRASFSDYLRKVLAARGIAEPDRKMLQDLGQSLVQSDPDAFCRNVIGQVAFVPGTNLVLDGIRHIDIQRRVAIAVLPSRARLIHLAADDDLLAQRVRRRGTSQMELQRANEHEVEQELLETLPGIANAIIYTSQSLSVVMRECLQMIEHWGGDPTLIQTARERLSRDLP
jgi:cytidylate kinase